MNLFSAVKAEDYAVKHLPGWLPFQRTANRGRNMIERLVTKPLDYVKDQMVCFHFSSTRPH